MGPLLFSVLLLASDPTTATPAASEPTEQAAPVKKEKKICKVDPAYTGSRMKKNLCLTEAQWEQRKQGVGNTSQTGRSYTAQ